MLVSPMEPPYATATDEVRSYEGSVLGTIMQDQEELLREAVAPLIPEDLRLGIDSVSYEGTAAPISKGAVNLNEELWRLRRRKEEDELALIQLSACAAVACYERARGRSFVRV